MSDKAFVTKMTDQAIMRADVWDSSDKRCHYCGMELHPLRTFCVDHIVPKCAGGADEMTNLVAACRACNHRKGINEDRALCARIKAERGEPFYSTYRGQSIERRQPVSLGPSSLGESLGITLHLGRLLSD